MIPCTDFIPAYSELFRYLDAKGGRQAVVEFWEFLSDNYLDELRDLVTEHGILGCWLYWTRTLNEEAADFTIELDEDAGQFRIDMHRCPSKGRLIECANVEPYPDYCFHCDVLYRRVLEPLGYEYSIDLSHCDEAACTLVVRTAPKPA
jgi:hypothetical protein